MPQVRITAPGQTGTNPAWIAWNELSAAQKSLTRAPAFEVPLPVGTLLDVPASHAEIYIGLKIAEAVVDPDAEPIIPTHK